MSESAPGVQGRLAWRLDLADRSIMLPDVDVHDRVVVIRPMPGGLVHLGSWRMRYGGALSEGAASELGVLRGWQDPALDETGWMGAQRINTISGCFPTWEADSYAGYAWYRSSFTLPGDVADDGRLRLGAPAEARSLEWQVWLDGQALTDAPVRTGVLDVSMPLAAGDHTLAVQLRISPPEGARSRAAELEGWRRVDPLCHSEITWHEGTEIVLDQPHGPDTLTDLTEQWRVRLDYTREAEAAPGHEQILRTATLSHSGPDPVVLDEVIIGGRLGAPAHAVHADGAWAGFADGWAVAAADPAAITVATTDGAVALCWPGIALAPDEQWRLPDLVLDRHPDDWRRAIHDRLDSSGPRTAPLAVYDPYGWYQISHASEPKLELDVALVEQLDPVIADLNRAGLRFSHLALDCGWNDPDDLSRFHPGNFPDGPEPILRLCADHQMGLILWVSPSDGARAFRHELGMVNPGFDASRIPGAGHRLCPAAEPWRSAFADALVGLTEDAGATGFKIDGTELYCTADDHGHQPGIWSVYATSRALITLFERLRQRADMVIMLYWGLRSPWWLRWADTVWEGAYLVEAAAPSGRPAWTLRSSVACCQDHGRRAAYPEIPPHRQDSLGVWLSGTTWASRQGSEAWDDALVLDVARSGGTLQPWGDLRAMTGDPERVGELAALFARRDGALAGTMTPLGDPISETGGYGYAWSAGTTTWVVLSQPGPSGTTRLPAWIHGTATLDYRSVGAISDAGFDAEGGWIAQSAGSVVAYAFSGERSVIMRPPAPPEPVGEIRLDPVRVDITGRPTDDDLVRLWTGRVPTLADWGQGPAALPAFTPDLADRVPALDRVVSGRHLTATATAELSRPGRLAMIVRWRRGEVAWHNDLLHEVTRLALSVDRRELTPKAFPDFRHEQAGSWSWMRYELDLAPGRHDLVAELTTCAPDNVDVDIDLWLR